MEFNRQLHSGWINGLVLLVKEHAKLRRHTALEDGDFRAEIAFAQQASAVRAFGRFRRGGFCIVVAVVVVRMR